ncbi:MAG: hypothetical protein JJ896_18350 [Rhodothermales bacterium]|nr:hypothetical protein [Rhodothermales bacterium]MBO6781626.1 hypothetical protein [Rhodothermales bacterium]
MRITPLLAAALFMVATASAQDAPSLRVSGVVFMDYTYVMQNPGGDAGDNGFGYRRLHLTSDFQLNPDMRFRARLEASDSKTNPDGSPSPFIKDLFFRWDDAFGEGHRLQIGVTPPPSYRVSEQFLGYRALEKTIMDLDGIVSSRDFGIAVQGPLGDGDLSYSVMLGNNSSVKQETDRHKRLYGRIHASPGDDLEITLGADYASLPGGSSLNTNAFLGYRLNRARVGVEGYYNAVRPEAPVDEVDRIGVSTFGAVALGESSELVARYDFSQIEENTGGTRDGWFALLGIAVEPRENVRFIPNVVLDNELGADEAMVTARMTLHIDF